MIFPEGVPLVGVNENEGGSASWPDSLDQYMPSSLPDEAEVSAAEHDLSSEEGMLDDQMATPIEDDGSDLLKS